MCSVCLQSLTDTNRPKNMVSGTKWACSVLIILYCKIDAEFTIIYKIIRNCDFQKFAALL